MSPKIHDFFYCDKYTNRIHKINNFYIGLCAYYHIVNKLVRYHAKKLQYERNNS
jgi:hypothetical protein